MSQDRPALGAGDETWRAVERAHRRRAFGALVEAAAFTAALAGAAGLLFWTWQSGLFRPAIYYPSCDEARMAGAAPLTPRDPGYRPGLDRDGDGVACGPFGL